MPKRNACHLTRSRTHGARRENTKNAHIQRLTHTHTKWVKFMACHGATIETIGWVSVADCSRSGATPTHKCKSDAKFAMRFMWMALQAPETWMGWASRRSLSECLCVGGRIACSTHEWRWRCIQLGDPKLKTNPTKFKFDITKIFTTK